MLTKTLVVDSCQWHYTITLIVHLSQVEPHQWMNYTMKVKINHILFVARFSMFCKVCSLWAVEFVKPPPLSTVNKGRKLAKLVILKLHFSFYSTQLNSYCYAARAGHGFFSLFIEPSCAIRDTLEITENWYKTYIVLGILCIDQSKLAIILIYCMTQWHNFG